MGRSQRVKGATFERDIAQQLGAKRNIGQARDGGDDITLGRLRIECKRRKRLGTVQAWLAQATAACDRDGDIPVVVAREDHGEALVLMRFADALPLLVAWSQVDSPRSPSHTARHATPAVGRPGQLRPAPATGLQRPGRVRGGAAAPIEPAGEGARQSTCRRQERGAFAAPRSQRANPRRPASEAAPAGALLPPTEASGEADSE